MAKIQFIRHSASDSFIIPPNLGDFIPADSPVRLFSEVLDLVDISDVVKSYGNAANGRSAFHPRMLLKAVIYGYFNDIYSTRDLEEAMRRDAHMIWLSSYQFPDHSTISRFKARCAGSIKRIFASLVSILAERGEIDLAEDLYVDGTTVRSRASRRSIKWLKTEERLSAAADGKIQRAVGALLKRIDEAQSNELLDGGRAECTPQAARRLADAVEERARQSGEKVKTIVKAARDAADSREAHGKAAEECRGRCGVAPADPDCGIMHAKEGGYDAKPTPNYNVQAATQNQYVTNYDVYGTPSDKAVALDFAETCVAENGVKPRAIVADAGYGCEEVYAGLEEMAIEAVVKYQGYDRDVRRRPAKEGEFDESGFRLNGAGDGLVCPAGHEMDKAGAEEEVTRRGYRIETTKFACSRIDSCPFRDLCPAAAGKERRISRRLGSMRHEARARERLRKPENREKMRRRRVEPEPVFGQLKHNRGYRRFRHFGSAKVRMDIGLMFMALNLGKLYKNLRKAA